MFTGCPVRSGGLCDDRHSHRSPPYRRPPDAAAWMISRETASPMMRDLVWTRVGLCHAIFDMLDILPPEGMRALFEEEDHA